MTEDLFSRQADDAEEPDSSPLLPAVEEDGPDDDWDSPAEQGLYVCLPAEQVTLAGFAQGGEADTMSPGPLLATVMHTVTGQDGAGPDVRRDAVGGAQAGPAAGSGGGEEAEGGGAAGGAGAPVPGGLG